jgi:25S rRNA (adenine2142-N1)-methyltransferase
MPNTSTPPSGSSSGPRHNKKRRRAPIPVAPSIRPAVMKSRKRARHVTTLFHRLTRDRDLALQRGDMKDVKECDRQLEEMGGREEYQRASQLSTSFHSTSKWVLGQLAHRGWLYGIAVDGDGQHGEDSDADDDTTESANGEDEKNGDFSNTGNTRPRKRKRPSRKSRRTTQILEVGAINTELLDAAAQPDDSISDSFNHNPGDKNKPKRYNIHVRAIDIHSMADGRIEEADFLELPFLHPDPTKRYDVIVCSMVLNCVTTATDRGRMLALLYHHLRPGGLCFFTIPKFCLTKSAFLTPTLFSSLLGETGVGFVVVATKESPRVSFFVLQRPTDLQRQRTGLDPKWTNQVVRNKGKKFPNQFSVVLRAEHVFGEDRHEEAKSR